MQNSKRAVSQRKSETAPFYISFRATPFLFFIIYCLLFLKKVLTNPL